TMSVSESRAVSISTGTGRSCWMRRHTSSPSSPGSIKSRTTRSGCTRSHTSTPPGPSVAISTEKPSLRNRAAIADAIDASSSMTTIVRAGESAAGAGDIARQDKEPVSRSLAGGVEIRCRCRGGRRKREGSGQGHDDVRVDGEADGLADGGDGVAGYGHLQLRTVGDLDLEQEVIAPERAGDDDAGDRPVRFHPQAVGANGDPAGAQRVGDVVAEEAGDELAGRVLPHLDGR